MKEIVNKKIMVVKGGVEMSYRIKTTCYDVDPKVPPYEELLNKRFRSREDATVALFDIVDAEAEDLNCGDADGEFYARFDNAAHDAVTEFWEGAPTENDRSFRIVTEYDIVEVDAEVTE